MDKEWIKLLLSFGSGFLIFLGFYNLQCYYWWFDINIYNYVSTGELILLFVSIIFQLLLIGLSILFYWYLTNFFHRLLFIGRDKRKDLLNESGDTSITSKVLVFLFSFSINTLSIIISSLLFVTLLIFLITITIQTNNAQIVIDNIRDSWKIFLFIIFVLFILRIAVKKLYINNKFFFLKNSFKYWFYEKFKIKYTKGIFMTFMTFIFFHY